MVALEEDFDPNEILICICGFQGISTEMFEHYIIKHPNLLIQLILDEE